MKLWPNLKLWHNGGDSKWVTESLNRLAIKPDQCINSYDYPHIKADLLLVPNFTSDFGYISTANLKWLEAFGVLNLLRKQEYYSYLGQIQAGEPFLAWQLMCPSLAFHQFKIN